MSKQKKIGDQKKTNFKSNDKKGEKNKKQKVEMKNKGPKGPGKNSPLYYKPGETPPEKKVVTFNWLDL